MALKILHADDHPLVRSGVRQIVDQLEVTTQLFEADNLAKVLHTLEEHPDMDLLILDLMMPGMEGFESYQRIEESNPQLPIAILSADEDSRTVDAAIRAGAAGYIPKSSSPDTMLAAIRIILDGGIYVPRQLMHNRHAVDSDQNAVDALTDRQRDVLQLVRKGLSNKVIAADLNITEKTVKHHMTAIFRVFQVTNRTQLVIKSNRILGGMTVDGHPRRR